MAQPFLSPQPKRLRPARTGGPWPLYGPAYRTLSEPAVDRSEELAGFGVVALVAGEPGKADGDAQLSELGLLLLGDVQRLAIEFLRDRGIPSPQQQLAFEPVQLCCKPVRPCSFDDLKGVVQLARGLFNLPRDLTCPS